MPKIKKQEKKIAWIVSSLVGVAVLVTAYIMLWNTPLFDEYLLLAVLIMIFPAAVLDYIDHSWKKSVDKHLPDLFLSIIQARKAGMSLPRALEETSKRRYGPLTVELKKMVIQMSWGVSFERAFKFLGERVGTALMKRVVPLVIEASRSGGRVEKVFAPTGRFIQTTLTMEKERQTQTRPYIAIVYVAFFVFLFTVIMLFKTLFIEAVDVPLLGSVVLTSEEARRLFFHMSAIQAFFGGLVAGKMGSGTVSAGLKHSVILLASGYLALKFLM